MSRARAWSPACILLALACSEMLAGGAILSEGQAPPRSGPVLDQKLVVGDITISYPTGMEGQARELMAVCQQVVPPRRERYLAGARAFSDEEAMAEQVADLLGCPDRTDMAYRLVCGVESSIETLADTVFLPILSDMRIYRQSDLVASGGLHTGVVDLTYDPATERFTLQIGSWMTSEKAKTPAGKGFLPLVVRDDGTFRLPPGLGLAEWVAQPLDEMVVGSAITARRGHP